MKMNQLFLFSLLTCLLLAGSLRVYAGQVTVPNSFQAGAKAMASEVNGNFTAVETAVNDNDDHIVILEAAVAALQTQLAAAQSDITTLQTSLASAQSDIATLQTALAAAQSNITGLQSDMATAQTDITSVQAGLAGANTNIVSLQSGMTSAQTDIGTLQTDMTTVQSNKVLELAPYVSVDTNVLEDLSGPHIIFTGANIHIRNGMDFTDQINGLGNLIIGYNERNQLPQGIGRGGSHNLAVGKNHEYTNYGGLVGGEENAVSGAAASVIGGNQNHAAEMGSTVTGGTLNTTFGFISSIIGGNGNSTIGLASTVTGGAQNTAFGDESSVSGGWLRSTNDQYDWVGGSLFENW